MMVEVEHVVAFVTNVIVFFLAFAIFCVITFDDAVFAAAIERRMLCCHDDAVHSTVERCSISVYT